MREINEMVLSIWILILNMVTTIPGVSAETNHCYSSGTMFGIIVLSVFATLFVIALTLALLWLLWTKNLLNLGKLLIDYINYGTICAKHFAFHFLYNYQINRKLNKLRLNIVLNINNE